MTDEEIARRVHVCDAVDCTNLVDMKFSYCHACWHIIKDGVIDCPSHGAAADSLNMQRELLFYSNNSLVRAEAMYDLLRHINRVYKVTLDHNKQITDWISDNIYD